MNIVNNAAKILMTQTEFAAHRGVERSAVSNWKKKNLLVFVEDATSGKSKIHVARSDARLNANIDPARGRPTNAQSAGAQSAPELDAPAPAARSDDGLGKIRTDLIVAQTVEKQLKNAKTAGELVMLADYESRAADYGRLVRERVAAVVRSNSERLAAETDPRIIVSFLSGELDAAFLDLSRTMTASPAAVEDDETVLDAEIEADAEAV